MTPEQLLREGLAVYGLPADAAAIEGLEEFSRRLLERNQVMNLTAITDPCDVAALHLLDCAYLLTAADFRGKSVVDVGTGAGFPGMPLRILEPNFDLTLLDSLGKRVDFLRETADAMGLRRVRCVHARAEEFARKHREQFDIATSRAVAQLNVLCELTLPLVKVGGVFLAMKSVESDPELQEARSAIAQLGGAVEDVTDYTIPGTEVTHRVLRSPFVGSEYAGSNVPGRPHPEGASHAGGLPPCFRPHQESAPAIKTGWKCPRSWDLRKFF